MKTSLIKIFISIFFLSFLTSCKKDDPIIPNEEEVITTLTYTLTPNDGSGNVVLKFKDLDGEGGANPTITSGILKANKTYNGSLLVLNEQALPAEDITAQIKEEEDEHQFFITSTIGDLAIAYADKDANGKPVGLNTILTTKAAGKGSLKVILRHKLNKSAMGVANGAIENAGGETDIEVTFNIDVQ